MKQSEPLLDLPSLRRELAQATSRAAIVAQLQERLDAANQIMEAQFDQSGDGIHYGRSRAHLFDQMIKALFDHIHNQEQTHATAPLALAAIGGYGNRLLCPGSDLDLLFLHSARANQHCSDTIRKFLYPLWDLGFKIGHHAMTRRQALDLWMQDHVFATATLDLRFIAGDKTFFTPFQRQINQCLLHNEQMRLWLFEAKCNERTQRHKRHLDAHHVLEPDVKNGKGGLRDLDVLHWITRIYHDLDAQHRFFDAQERLDLQKAWRFLICVRTHMHLLCKRAEERLTFDLQATIAVKLGYRSRRSTISVERFMKHYFVHSEHISHLSQTFMTGLEEYKRSLDQRSHQWAEPQSRIGRFRCFGRMLGLPVGPMERMDPVHFFTLCAKYQLEPDPRALRIIRREVRALTREDAHTTDARESFLAVLLAPQIHAQLLRRMHETGLLGKIIPDFARITAQMQYDTYHIYTTDEHTIRAIALLQEIERGKARDRFPIASEVIGKIGGRRTLYVAVFLHDIAKGRGGDHSELGAELARDLTSSLGFEPAEIATIAWLVRHHLAMSNAAFRRDLDDPKTIDDFAALVQTHERLNLLLCLTVADIAAVGPSVWTSWKATLLRQLYRASLARLGGELQPAARIASSARQRFIDALGDQMQARMAAEYLLDTAPPAHFIAYLPTALMRQCQLIADYQTRLDQAKPGKTGQPSPSDQLAAIAFHPVAPRECIEMLVYTKDCANLAGKIAAAIALHQGNVVNARISIFADSMILDHFELDDPKRLWRDDPERRQRLQATLGKILAGTLDIGKEFKRRKKPAAHPGTFAVKTNVLINNNASAASTLIEITCLDRPGLLHELAHGLHQLGLNIQFARISTYGEEAVDVFYVRDRAGRKLDHPQRLALIHRHLMAIANTEAG